MIVQIARNFDRPKIDIFKSLQILLSKVKAANNLDFQGLGIENIIVGRLIPAGTGYYMNQVRKEAVRRDKLALEEAKQSS